ncbi:hypothetical protein SKAU_G00173310 [Synaphobranchus kaupii]|uniref:G-protein coupled receptors family 1 profile domain-containing protein n=1 Tax=Synaphobranchus kaupii TaxID=118154 RepID=A0A9Q1FKZ6_SYNKA|nr:hypothetical protein SKAU_G00173310 [Synaphobranchus kaupii]
MDFTPNLSSSNGFSVGRVGNMCDIDFNQDTIFLPVLYGVVFTVGVPLNLLALYGLYHLIKSENVLPVYLINLLLSDLLQLLTLPLWIDYYRSGHSWQYGHRACQMMYLIFYVTIYASIFFMCVIALERHIAITQPLKFQAIRSFSLSSASENYTLCIEKYPSEEGYVTYRLVTLILSFFLPFGFIIILHRKTLQALTGLGSLEKKRIRGLLSLLVVVFGLVLGPYHLIGCVKYVGLLFHPTMCQWEKTVFLPYQVGRGLFSLNCLLYPVFYIFLRSDFRDGACRYLPCLDRMLWFTRQEDL